MVLLAAQGLGNDEIAAKLGIRPRDRFEVA
jgi:hypothetical protein